jgi:hypothetical protein
MRKIIFGAVLGISVCAPAMAQQIFFDDFSSGNDGQWVRVDPIGGSTFGVVGGRYQMTSAVLPPMPSPAVGLGAFIADSAANNPQYANGTLRTSLLLDNGATNALVTARANNDATLGYTFFINNVNTNSNFIGIGLLGVSSALASMSMPISEGVEYIIEASFFGTALSLKVWEAGQPEPAQPQVMWSDATFTSGAVGLGLYNQPTGSGGVGGALSGSFDNVSFTIPAPGGPVLAAFAGVLMGGRRRRSSRAGQHPHTAQPPSLA